MTDEVESLEDFLTARDKAFRELDIEWARERILRMNPSARLTPPDDEKVLASLHKARYECVVGLEDSYRRESEQWLKERQLLRMNGLPWPADGSLPTKES